MKTIIALIIAYSVFVGVQADIVKYSTAAQDPLNANGVADLQMVIEQSIDKMDALTVEPCFRAWWAFERTSLFVLGESLRLHVMGNTSASDDTLLTAAVLRYYGKEALATVDCISTQVRHHAER